MRQCVDAGIFRAKRSTLSTLDRSRRGDSLVRLGSLCGSMRPDRDIPPVEATGQSRECARRKRSPARAMDRAQTQPTESSVALRLRHALVGLPLSVTTSIARHAQIDALRRALQDVACVVPILDSFAANRPRVDDCPFHSAQKPVGQIQDAAGRRRLRLHLSAPRTQQGTTAERCERSHTMRCARNAATQHSSAAGDQRNQHDAWPEPGPMRDRNPQRKDP